MTVLRRFAVEYELIRNPIYPMPGLKQVLHTLRRRGMLMGIISNAQFYTPPLLEWLIGASLSDAGFAGDLMFFSYRLKQAKPSPLLFDQAAARLAARGESVQEVLYVGNDMRNDIAPASLRGFKTALFAGDRRSLRLRADDPLCRDVRPNVVLNHLVELLSYAA
jgi:putative hydrolase of the HAD superfamily